MVWPLPDLGNPMNAKTTTDVRITIGSVVQIISVDGSQEQAETLGMVGHIVEKNGKHGDPLDPVNALVDVRFPDGRIVVYLTKRLHVIAVAVADTIVQDTCEIAPDPEIVVIELTGEGIKLTGDVTLDGSVKASEPIDEPALAELSIGTQVMIVGCEWHGKGPNPTGLFGMINRKGPLYGAHDREKVYDFTVHTTDGRNICVMASNISPIIGVGSAPEGHPIALMEKLGKLHRDEKAPDVESVGDSSHADIRRDPRKLPKGVR